MKKLKFLILIPFIFTFAPSVNSEAYVKVKSGQSYSVKFKVKGDHLSTSKSCKEVSSDIDRKKKKDGGSGKKDCNTKITPIGKDSGWTTYLSARSTHTFSLDTIGIEVGDPYTIQWDAYLGGKGYCGARSMTRRKGDTTNTYYMQNVVTEADCSTTRR